MKNITLIITILCSIGLFAADRATVADMRAKLALPDGSNLHVEVFNTCSDGSTNVGALLFSQQQVDIFAAGLDALYGTEVGNNVRQQWSVKANPEDPRLPTYLVVLNSGTSSSVSSKTTTTTSYKEYPTYTPPITFGNCGGSVHEPVEG